VGKGHGIGEEGLDLELRIDPLLEPAEKLQEKLIPIEHRAVALVRLGGHDLQGLGGLGPHAVKRPQRPAGERSVLSVKSPPRGDHLQEELAQPLLAEGIV
jgi:hypothetical protein